MADQDDNIVDEVMKRRMSRRRAISNGAKLGGAVVATAVVAGGLGYYAGSSSSSSASKTVTATNTVTSTVTTGGGTTTVTTGGNTSATGTTSSTSTGTSSSGTVNYANYPAWVGLWPLDYTPPNAVAGLKGSCRSVQFDTITLQSDATVPGTRAYSTQAALNNTYPNVTWTNYDSGATGTPTITALAAGQNNWDVTRGNVGILDVPLGYCEPMTDYFNDWTDKGFYSTEQMAAGLYNGDYYLLPDCQDVHAGWWRMDLFAAAGYGTFDFNTLEYTGTTPNEMGYTELGQADAKITAMGSSRNVYSTMIPNQATAILGPWYVDHFIRANGGLRYWGDGGSCTITMGNAPYYNNNLDALTFLQSNLPSYVPGGATLDLNALITEITSGSLGYSFGPDPNLDGAMQATAASSSNPAAPAGVNVRDCIQPTTGWSDGKPLDPALPPSWAVSSYDAILRGATNPAASWEWMRTYSGFSAWMFLLGNASGLPSRSDVSAILSADVHADQAPWVAAYTGWTWSDPPIQSGIGPALNTAYDNTIDPFLAGTGTAEACVSGFVSAATAALNKASWPAFTGTLPT